MARTEYEMTQCAKGLPDCGQATKKAWNDEPLCDRCFDNLVEEVAVKATRMAKQDTAEASRLLKDPPGSISALDFQQPSRKTTR